ncbi:hypothetical protein AAC387_Pa05g0705 [Persea americana]
MAEAAVAFLLPKLYDVIQRRVVSFLDTPEEARKLHETLKFLQAFLQDADEKRKESKTIETWVSQVRDAAFEAEDIIDEFILKVDKKHLRDRDFIGFLTLHCRRFQTWGKIQRINERLEKIAANRSKYGIVASGGPSTSSTKTERRAPIVEEVDVVGIQDQAKMVAKLLIGEEDRRCVVSIVGMGGLEDSIIPVTELVRIWVAEGFIEERGDETMEEVAEDCLWELTQRRAMPNIRYLEIYHCYKLKMVPEGLRDLTTLQELVFAGQPGFFLDRVGKTGEDYCKIQHVPTITIR